MGNDEIKGVVETPTPLIHTSIQESAHKVLSSLSDGEKAALLGVATPTGVNLAFALNTGNGWQVASWVGKSGWDTNMESLDGGVFVKKVWK